MRLSAQLFFVFIVHCILLCEGRRRSSYGDDNYYQSRIQNAHEEIYRRTEDLENDKHNLKENRPTGKFSYAGHQEQLENKIRHLENLQQEYNDCIGSGMCGGNHDTYHTPQQDIPHQPTDFQSTIPTQNTQQRELQEFLRSALGVLFVIPLLFTLWDVWHQNYRNLCMVLFWLVVLCMDSSRTNNDLFWLDPLAMTLVYCCALFIAVKAGLQSILFTKQTNSYFAIGLDLCKNVATLEEVRFPFQWWYRWMFSPPPPVHASVVNHLIGLVMDINAAFIVCCVLYLLTKIVSSCFLSGQNQIAWNRLWILSFLLSIGFVFVNPETDFTMKIIVTEVYRRWQSFFILRYANIETWILYLVVSFWVLPIQ